MANQNISRDSVRIPNLPMGRIVDANGQPTDEEQTFRQALLTLLQSLFGTEGVVMPSQTATNITSIQNNTDTTPGTSPATTVYTCQFGTMIYDSTDNSIRIAIDSGGPTHAPVFKTVTLT